jgi:hypothetical protein
MASLLDFYIDLNATIDSTKVQMHNAT